MAEEKVFKNVWGATVGYDRPGESSLSIIRQTDGDDDGELFNARDWNITIILTPKAPSPGWYVDRYDLENPSDDDSYGVVASLAYYTVHEIRKGDIPDEGMIRVQVVPYPEA